MATGAYRPGDRHEPAAISVQVSGQRPLHTGFGFVRPDTGNACLPCGTTAARAAAVTPYLPPPSNCQKFAVKKPAPYHRERSAVRALWGGRE